MDQTPSGSDDWLLSPSGPEPAPAVATPTDVLATPSAPRNRKVLLGGAGLVVAGLVAGAVGGSALSGHATPTTSFTPAGNQLAGGLPGQGLEGAGGGPFQGSGVTGEQRIQGTLAAIGASSVSVKTSSGTATYLVNGTSQIMRDGQQAALSQLKVGDAVFLHVYPAASGSALVVERLFAGTLPQGGFPGGPPGGPTGQQDATSTQPGGVVKTS